MIEPRMRRGLLFVMVVGALLMASTPASAQFFLCEKTFDDGTTVHPDNPQYQYIEYDTQLVYLLQPLVRWALIGLFLFGVAGGVYASIRNTFFQPGDDDDPAKFVKMRVKLTIAGVALPIVILVGSWILEWVTEYETTCMIPNFL